MVVAEGSSRFFEGPRVARAAEGSKGSSNTNPTKVSPVVGDPKLQNLQEVRKKHGADSKEYKNALKAIEASANSSKDGSN